MRQSPLLIKLMQKSTISVALKKSYQSQHDSNQNQLDGVQQNDLSSNKSVYNTLTSASVQTAASFILEWCPNLIIIFFLSRVSRDDLVAGYGFGIMWVNCFGLGLLNGLACVHNIHEFKGLETMVCQAFGAEKLKVCGGIYNRAIFVIIVSMIPIFFLQYFGSNILGLLNNNPTLVRDAGIVTSTMIPAIFLNGIYVTTKCFLNGQNIYNYQFITQFIVTILHVLWSYLLIERLDMGLQGASLSRFFTEVLSNIILFSIMKITRCSDKVMVKFEKSQIYQCWSFLRIAMPIGSLLWLEWLCYECYSLQASQLSEQKFGANVIMNNLATLYFQFAYGISIAATTYVGLEMGKRQSGEAKKFALASFIITSIFLVITQILLFIFRDQFVQIFTTDKQIQGELLNTHLFLQGLMVLDSYQAVITGIVRGIGRENIACISFISFYFVVGQTSSYIFCFVVGMELNGIWLGLIIGAGGYDILQILNLGLSNWTSLVDQIEFKIHSQDQIEQAKILDDTNDDEK